MNVIKGFLKKYYKSIGALVMVLSICGASGIAGYLTDSAKADNVIPIGGNIINIIEEFDPPEEIVPGGSFTKDVKVKNTGSTPCYVRIKALFSNSHMEQYCEIDWNETDWAYNAEDGYYYYPDPLPSGVSTPSLMTTVKIKEGTPEGEITDFNIIVYAESYQSYGFDNYQDAWVNYHKNKS